MAGRSTEPRTGAAHLSEGDEGHAGGGDQAQGRPGQVAEQQQQVGRMQDVVLRGSHKEEGERDGHEAGVPQQLRAGEAQQGE